MLFKVGCELIVHDLVNQCPYIGVTKLGLGLALELGVGELYGNDCRNALPAVVTRDLVVALDNTVFHTVGIENPGQGRFEAGFVHTALGSAHIVGKGH